jgi:chromate transporter
MTRDNFGSPDDDLFSFIASVVIFVVAFVGTKRFKVNPILMIVLCGIAGLFIY